MSSSRLFLINSRIVRNLEGPRRVGRTIRRWSSLQRRSLAQQQLLVNDFHHDQPSWISISPRSMVMVTQTKAGEDLSSQRQAADSASEEVAAEDQNTDTLLIISDSCWKRIHHLAQKKGSSLSVVYLRVFVDAGGCSGFTYQFEIDTDENLEKDDIVFTGPEGARVVVDPGSLEFIKGSTIDYVQEMIKSAFEVRDNPQSESACGCGSSFALKNFEANPAVD